jgi:polysaccharide pyruvyl transferase WcaK-like protein
VSPPDRVAAISVSTQFENVGDAWLHRELIRLARERATTWVDVSRCPPGFAASLALDGPPAAVRIDGVMALVARMITQRLRGGVVTFFLGPGGYHGELRGRALLRAWIATAVLAVLRVAGVRCCLIGTSYDRIGPRQRQLLRLRSRLLYEHVVRDEASRRVAHEIGMDVDGVLPDLSWATLPSRHAAPAEGTVALAFRGDQWPEQPEAILRFARALVQSTDPATSWRAVAQVERDVPVAHAVADAIEQTGRHASVAEVYQDLDQAAASYVGCSHVIGNRLHALLLGVRAGCAPLAFVDARHNAKIVGSFADLGWTDRVVTFDEPGAAERVAERLRTPFDHPQVATAQRNRIERYFDGLLGTPAERRATVGDA